MFHHLCRCSFPERSRKRELRESPPLGSAVVDGGGDEGGDEGDSVGHHQFASVWRPSLGCTDPAGSWSRRSWAAAAPD